MQNGDDTCPIAHGDLPSSAHDPIFVAAQVEGEPADEDRGGADDAHGVQDQTRIPDAAMVVDIEKDQVARDGEGEAWDDKG